MGWSLKRSQLSPVKILILCASVQATSLIIRSYACDVAVVPLNSNLPVTTSALLETGTSARGTGTPHFPGSVKKP